MSISLHLALITLAFSITLRSFPLFILPSAFRRRGFPAQVASRFSLSLLLLLLLLLYVFSGLLGPCVAAYRLSCCVVRVLYDVVHFKYRFTTELSIGFFLFP